MSQDTSKPPASDPVAFVDTSPLPLEKKLQNVVESNRGAIDVDVPYGLDGANMASKRWHVGTSNLSRYASHGISYAKRPNTRSDKDVLMVEALVSGHYTNGVGGAPDRAFQAGRVSLCTEIGSRNEVSHNVRALEFVVPFETVGFDPSKHGALTETAIPFDSPVGRVLSAAITDTVARMPYVPAEEAARMTGTLTSLVADLVLQNRAHADRESLRKAHRLAMDAWIEAHITQRISPERLAQNFALSRASVYRLYCDEGGVEAYVARRRLYRCRLVLQQTPEGRGAVKRVAEHFGYFDSANFNRAFRRQFGVNPSEYLAPVLRPIRAPFSDP